ncbi:MAG: IS200/IS605 family transposase, partial [Chloroflexota bacterium]
SGADYLVYSTLAAAEVVLSMAFQAETPLGQIRKQAKRATEALFQAPAIEATAPAQTQIQTADATQTQPSPSITGNLTPESPRSGPPAVAEPATIEDIPQTIDWASSPAEPPADTSLPIDWASILTRPPTDIPMPIDSALLSAHEEAADQLHTTTQQTDNITTTPQRPPKGASTEWEPALDDLEPIPDEATLNELSNTILQLSRQSLNQSLVEPSSVRDLSPTPLPKVRRTPHSLYDLSYTFLIIPRLPTTLLTGDLKNRVEGWLLSIAAAYDWQTQAIGVEPDHVEISLGCLPTDSPESVVKALILETSDKVLIEFPRLAASHAKRPGNFWAPAYYVVAPGRPRSPDEVSAFVEYQRREQGGGKY